MIPYLLLFLLPALLSLSTGPAMRTRRDGTHKVRFDISWMLAFLLMTTIIGLRYKVGADWYNYLRYINSAAWMDISDISFGNDPAYWFINILSVKLGWGITGVNLIGAIVFSAGLVLFCRSMPRPWLALASAIPFLVIVVAMGYTRQGIAVGFAMIGFVALGRQKLLWFAFWVVAGALFHKSAVVLLPLAGLVQSRGWVFSVPLILVAFGSSYIVLLQDSVDQLVNDYVDENMVSTGAMIRLAMNAVPASLFLYYGNRFIISDAERRFYGILSLLSLAMFAAFFVTNLTTALDRLALYIIPLQLVVFSRLPDALGRPGKRNQDIVLCILLYYFLVLLIWLNFASHARFWLPYQMGWADS